ncbi:MAG: acetolactate synthase AlsS [Reyranellales bacterium]
MNRRDVLIGTTATVASTGSGDVTVAQAQTTPQPGVPSNALKPEQPFQGRHLIVDALEIQGLSHVFGVPGAAIDPIIDAMIGRKVQFVHAGHEAHAAFMAGAFGRVTGRPGVCMSTSGPGTTNLAAGLVCATAEGDPAVAITGEPARDLRYRIGNQNINATAVFTPIAKSSVEVEAPEALVPALANAFRTAAFPRQGGAHVAVPLDITMGAATRGTAFAVPDAALGAASQEQLKAAAILLRSARSPIVLVGGAGATLRSAQALRSFLTRAPLPVVEVFEAAGCLSRSLGRCFAGRVGDHANQPGDGLLRRADVVLTIGFDLSEYDPTLWHKGSSSRIIHIGDCPTVVAPDYRPELVLLGEIAANLDGLQRAIDGPIEVDWAPVKTAQDQLAAFRNAIAPLKGSGVSPIAFIRELRALLADNVTVVSDVGSIGLWMVRNFLAYEPRRFLVDSKGWGALGTGLPKSIGAAFARPGEKVVCMTGDGSFLMGGMEMQTAARLKLPIVQVIWQDGTYDLVKITSQQKFGRWGGFAFKTMDIEAFAGAFGAKGFRIERDDEIRPVLARALTAEGPVMVDLRIDYSGNASLVEKSLIAYAP